MAYTTIKKPSDYFNTKLYTGNGATQSITGVGFQPDWVWIKNRDNSYNNALFDAVRGVTKFLASNNSDAEQTNANELTAFGTDGFTTGNASRTNNNNDSFASWNWKANGTGVANTDGSISSTVSVNTTSGFSIVSWSGNGSNPSTVGHGLGVAPKMIIARIRNSSDNWRVGHDSLSGWNYNLSLQSTEAQYINTNVWNSTAPSSTYFTIGAELNSGSGTYIAYCFAEKQGFSKFGSYTGNGSADGTFVYTGFKPAFVMVKASSIVESWYTYDNKRTTSGGNPEDRYLLPNQNIAEGTFAIYDFLSNGFKLRDVNPGFNNSGVSYIYMAFAEQPLVGDNPATAR